MRLTIPRKTLSHHLSRLAPFAGRPGLVRIAATEPDRLLLAATDSAAWSSAAVAIEGGVEPGGHVACDLDLLRGVVAACDAESISVAVGKTHVEVADDSGSSRVRTIDPATIPPMPVIDGEPTTADLPAFAAAIKSVLPAVAAEQARYAINGVCLDGGDAVATDGRMLATRSCASVGSEPVLLPTRLARAIVDLAKWTGSNLPQSSAGVAISLRVSRSLINAVVEHGGTAIEVGSTRIEGLYPPWRSVIPKASPTATLEVEVEALAALLRRAGAMTDAASRGVRLSLDGGRLSASSRGQGGEAEVGIEVEGKGRIQIGANAEQLVALLDACPAPRVALAMTAPERPIVLSVDEAGWTAVLMPLSL